MRVALRLLAARERPLCTFGFREQPQTLYFLPRTKTEMKQTTTSRLSARVATTTRTRQ